MNEFGINFNNRRNTKVYLSKRILSLTSSTLKMKITKNTNVTRIPVSLKILNSIN